MTPLVRRFIKTAIAFLLIGLLLGVHMLIQRDVFGAWPPRYLVSAHTHAVFVGFVMFMILGVALWIFPKPLAEDRRFRPRLIEAVYWLLLLGTLLRFVGELARAYSVVGWLAAPVLVGGLMQAAGLALYVWTMWYRIRASARQLRESRAEDRD